MGGRRVQRQSERESERESVSDHGFRRNKKEKMQKNKRKTQQMHWLVELASQGLMIISTGASTSTGLV